MFKIAATVAQPNEAMKQQLTDFGAYVAECLPKYVQKVEVSYIGDLEVSQHNYDMLSFVQQFIRFGTDNTTCKLSTI